MHYIHFKLEGLFKGHYISIDNNYPIENQMQIMNDYMKINPCIESIYLDSNSKDRATIWLVSDYKSSHELTKDELLRIKNKLNIKGLWEKESF